LRMQGDTAWMVPAVDTTRQVVPLLTSLSSILRALSWVATQYCSPPGAPAKLFDIAIPACHSYGGAHLRNDWVGWNLQWRWMWPPARHYTLEILHKSFPGLSFKATCTMVYTACPPSGLTFSILGYGREYPPHNRRNVKVLGH